MKRVETGQWIRVVAKELGWVEQMLRDWVKAAKAGKLHLAGAKSVIPEQMELSRVWAKNAQLRMEVEIRKEATAYFTKDARSSTLGSSGLLGEQRTSGAADARERHSNAAHANLQDEYRFQASAAGCAVCAGPELCADRAESSLERRSNLHLDRRLSVLRNCAPPVQRRSSGLVDQAAEDGGHRRRCADRGLIPSKADALAAPSLRLRQPVRQRLSPGQAGGVFHCLLKEPQVQLLRDRADGQLLQPPEVRTGTRHASRHRTPKREPICSITPSCFTTGVVATPRSAISRPPSYCSTGSRLMRCAIWRLEATPLLAIN